MLWSFLAASANAALNKVNEIMKTFFNFILNQQLDG